MKQTDMMSNKRAAAHTWNHSCTLLQGGDQLRTTSESAGARQLLNLTQWRAQRHLRRAQAQRQLAESSIAKKAAATKPTKKPTKKPTSRPTKRSPPPATFTQDGSFEIPTDQVAPQQHIVR